MAKTVLIDLKSKDKKQRAKARTIATDKATGLQFAGFNKEHGDLLVVIAETFDEVTAVAEIRKTGMVGVKLERVETQS